MENKNNIVIILLIVLIGVVSSIGLLIGVNNAIAVALNPINARLVEIERSVRVIEVRVNNGTGGGVGVDLSGIQNQLTNWCTHL